MCISGRGLGRVLLWHLLGGTIPHPRKNLHDTGYRCRWAVCISTTHNVTYLTCPKPRGVPSNTGLATTGLPKRDVPQPTPIDTPPTLGSGNMPAKLSTRSGRWMWQGRSAYRYLYAGERWRKFGAARAISHRNGTACDPLTICRSICVSYAETKRSRLPVICRINCAILAMCF